MQYAYIYIYIYIHTSLSLYKMHEASNIVALSEAGVQLTEQSGDDSRGD